MAFGSTGKLRSPDLNTPFNILAGEIPLSAFSEDEIALLFAQRTAETGQKITQEALDYVVEQSQGQPWIVNNLFKRVTMQIFDEDSTETVTKKHIQLARKEMVDARETHLDSLEYRLKDPHVKRVIEAIFTGSSDSPLNVNDHDVQLCLDLGLIRFDNDKGYVIANPLYEETLTRFLDDGYRTSAPPPSSWKWQKADGTLDMDALLKEFQKFWRRNSEIWEQKADYTEAFPHLLLMGFLQRVTNGSGTVEREAAAGSGRMDLAVKYHEVVNIIEIKLVRDYDSPETVREEGLEQISRYRDRVDTQAPAWLVIFDRRSAVRKTPWEKRLSWEEIKGTDNAALTIVGC
jgi:hypothetical protein